MTCREFAEFLGDHVAGELGPEARATFERHLALCPNCRRYLAQYRRSIELGVDAFRHVEAVVPDDVPEDLIRGILEARRLDRRNRAR